MTRPRYEVGQVIRDWGSEFYDGGTPVPKVRRKKSYQQICEEKGWEVGICPICKCRMQMIEILEPLRAPPALAANSLTAHK